MKKRVYSLLLALCIGILSGCGGEEVKNNLSQGNASLDASGVQSAAESVESTQDSELDQRGIESNTVTFNGKSVVAKIRVPGMLGYTAGRAYYGDNLDGTTYHFGGYVQTMEIPLYETLPETLEAYEEQILSVFKKIVGSMQYSNGAFVADTTEIVEINGYEMCRFTATHTYDYFNYDWETVPMTQQCAGYITRLKNNGGVVYWIVVDESEDQSLGDLLLPHADSMAQSLWEEVL